MGRHHSNEVIISTILKNSSIEETAEQLGLSVRTVRNRLKQPACRKLLDEANKESLCLATGTLQRAVNAAVLVLLEAMEDRSTSQGIRIAASQYVLKYALRYSELVDFESRISALEARLNDKD